MPALLPPPPLLAPSFSAAISCFASSTSASNCVSVSVSGLSFFISALSSRAAYSCRTLASCSAWAFATPFGLVYACPSPLIPNNASPRVRLDPFGG